MRPGRLLPPVYDWFVQQLDLSVTAIRPAEVSRAHRPGILGSHGPDHPRYAKSSRRDHQDAKSAEHAQRAGTGDGKAGEVGLTATRAKCREYADADQDDRGGPPDRNFARRHGALHFVLRGVCRPRDFGVVPRPWGDGRGGTVGRVLWDSEYKDLLYNGLSATLATIGP